MFKGDRLYVREDNTMFQPGHEYGKDPELLRFRDNYAITKWPGSNGGWRNGYFETRYYIFRARLEKDPGLLHPVLTLEKEIVEVKPGRNWRKVMAQLERTVSDLIAKDRENSDDEDNARGHS